jgi:DNA mismatch repair protein MutS
MPSVVVDRAGHLLKQLEAERTRAKGPQTSLFDAQAEVPLDDADALRDALAEIDPDTLSPRDALAALYRLKTLESE